MKDAKAALRKEMKARRSALAAAHPDAGERLAEAFEARGYWPHAEVVAGFHPFGSEIDPLPLLMQFHAHGYGLALPKIVPPLISEGNLKFHEWSPGRLLVEGPYGILQPDDTALEVFPDIILTPLLAFDREGGRLGYGGGFYDRALDYLKAAKRGKDSPLQVWGVAFSAQEVARVPTEPHDQRLDAVLTEQGVIEIRKNP